jgi:hypothetical protein
MDERLEHLEGVCECALHAHLMLEMSEHRVAKAAGDEEDDVRDVILPPLVITLARLLAARFRRRADSVVDEAVAGFEQARTAEQIAAVVEKLGVALGAVLASASSGDVSKAVQAMFQKAKAAAAGELHVQSTFSSLDGRTQEWLQRAYPWWIGGYHSSVLAKQIDAIARYAIIERGLSGSELAALMRDQLSRLYGLGRGRKSPVVVPRSFRGQPDLYWVGLANNAATQAMAFARLSAMREAGVLRYAIASVGDERVCALCRFMDGKEFSIADGESFRDAVIATKTPDEYKAVAGWMTVKVAMKLFDEGGDAALAKTSLLLPSYHFLCRCTVSPVT